jgi:hypothetical protein
VIAELSQSADDVIAELRPYHWRNLPNFERKGCLLEFPHHLAVAKEAEVSAPFSCSVD